MNRINRVEEDIRLLQAKSESVQAGSVDVAFDDSELVSKYRKLAQRFRVDDGETTIKEQKVATEKGRFTKFFRRVSTFALPFIPRNGMFPSVVEVEQVTQVSSGKTYETTWSKNDKYFLRGLLFRQTLRCTLANGTQVPTDTQWNTIYNVPSKVVFGPTVQVDPPIGQYAWKSKIAYFELNSSLLMIFIYPIFSIVNLPNNYPETVSDENLHHLTHKYDGKYFDGALYYLALSPTRSANAIFRRTTPQFSPFKLVDDHYEPESVFTKGPWIDFFYKAYENRRRSYGIGSTITVEGDTINPNTTLKFGYSYAVPNWSIAEKVYDNFTDTDRVYEFQSPTPYSKAIAKPQFTPRTYAINGSGIYDLPVYAPMGLSVNNGTITAGGGDIFTDKTYNSMSTIYTPGNGCHICTAYPNVMLVRSNIEINDARREGTPTGVGPWSIGFRTVDHFGWDDMEIFEVVRYGLE